MIVILVENYIYFRVIDSPRSLRQQIVIAAVFAIVSKPADGKNLPSTFSQQIEVNFNEL